MHDRTPRASPSRRAVETRPPSGASRGAARNRGDAQTGRPSAAGATEPREAAARDRKPDPAAVALGWIARLGVLAMGLVAVGLGPLREPLFSPELRITDLNGAPLWFDDVSPMLNGAQYHLEAGRAFLSASGDAVNVQERRTAVARAITAFEATIGRRPIDAWAWSQLPLAYALAGRRDDAVAAYRRSHEIAQFVSSAIRLRLQGASLMMGYLSPEMIEIVGDDLKTLRDHDFVEFNIIVTRDRRLRLLAGRLAR